jgi:ribosomal protein L40E
MAAHPQQQQCQARLVANAYVCRSHRCQWWQLEAARASKHAGQAWRKAAMMVNSQDHT